MDGKALLEQRLDADGILMVLLDRPDSGANILDGRLLEELDRLCEEIAGRDDVRALLFASAKPGMFIAGAGLDRIEQMTDASEAAEWARFGQSVLGKLAGLGRPTAAAIAGRCLGAGAELALAVDYRVASTDRRVRMGL